MCVFCGDVREVEKKPHENELDQKRKKKKKERKEKWAIRVSIKIVGG